jgi:hypothetical protein
MIYGVTLLITDFGIFTGTLTPGIYSTKKHEGLNEAKEALYNSTT